MDVKIFSRKTVNSHKNIIIINCLQNELALLGNMYY